MSSPKRIVKVAVPCPLFQSFDYLLPAAAGNQIIEDRPIEPGSRVRVSFGRQKLIGIILEESTDSEYALNKLKPVSEILDERSLLPRELLDLLQWAARYYVHPLGDVLQTALPVYLRNNDDATPTLNEVWRLMPVEHAPDNHDTDIEQSLKRAPKQKQIYQLLADAGETGLDADAFNTLTDNWRSPLKSLQEKGLVVKTDKPAVLQPQTDSQHDISLTDEQSQVVDAIKPRVEQHRVHVLNGITGSGKTEVYLSLCEMALAKGKQVLVLVPEIGLTPQLTQRFQQRLHTTIAVLHSGMNAGQRYASWHAAANRQAHGAARSMFSRTDPGTEISIVDNRLGLTVVDDIAGFFAGEVEVYRRKSDTRAQRGDVGF